MPLSLHGFCFIHIDFDGESASFNNVTEYEDQFRRNLFYFCDAIVLYPRNIHPRYLNYCRCTHIIIYIYCTHTSMYVCTHIYTYTVHIIVCMCAPAHKRLSTENKNVSFKKRTKLSTIQ